MEILKSIIARIWAVWTLIVFGSTIIPVMIISLIVGLWPEPKRSKIIHTVFQIWMKIFFILIGIRRIIKGKHHFEKGKNYVIVCNHNSFMDVPLTSPGIPGANKTIAKVEMARIPVFGVVYKRGSVLVDRKSEESRKASYGKMKQVLEMGMHMCIYPEGTRNKSKEPLQRFHDGAFKLAVETSTPIIPAVIFNTKEVMPTNKTFYVWPRSIQMHFLPPISVGNKSSQELKEEVFQIMKQYYMSNYLKLK